MSVAAQSRSVASLTEAYRAVRSATAALAAPLSAEDCAVQSMPDASPVKWHLAHTSWFFETTLLAQRKDYCVFDPAFAYLFNSYYESAGPRHPRPRRGLITRPSLEQVLAYRAHVDLGIEDLLSNADEAQAALLTLGLHHEQQHQELILTDVKHAFFCNPMLPVYREMAETPHIASALEWSGHPGGIVSVGHSGPIDPRADCFAFDNESPRHQVLLRPFRIASRPVSNGEYAAFIADGGYHRADLWLSDGWARVQSEGWQAPLYWLRDDDGSTRIFTLNGLVTPDAAAPVTHVSFFEAAAYAAWAGKRLATEFEWEAAAPQFSHGEVWEWTRSAYDPYPGYRPFEGMATEYNGKFMVGQMVLRGGSIVTPPGHVRTSYRNFFPPETRWQFSGIRLAEDA